MVASVKLNVWAMGILLRFFILLSFVVVKRILGAIFLQQIEVVDKVGSIKLHSNLIGDNQADVEEKARHARAVDHPLHDVVYLVLIYLGNDV